jgi:hypothetical protein
MAPTAAPGGTGVSNNGVPSVVPLLLPELTSVTVELVPLQDAGKSYSNTGLTCAFATEAASQNRAATADIEANVVMICLFIVIDPFSLVMFIMGCRCYSSCNIERKPKLRPQKHREIGTETFYMSAKHGNTQLIS